MESVGQRTPRQWLQSGSAESASQRGHCGPPAGATRGERPAERNADCRDYVEHQGASGASQFMKMQWPLVRFGEVLRRSNSTVDIQPKATYRQITRSEERRVGKESRSRWSPY